MPKTDAFAETFQTLRSILERNGGRMKVVADTDTEFSLASPTMTDRTGRPLFAAAVQVRKSYVSYHLMPLYMNRGADGDRLRSPAEAHAREGVLQLQDHRPGRGERTRSAHEEGPRGLQGSAAALGSGGWEGSDPV